MLFRTRISSPCNTTFYIVAIASNRLLTIYKGFTKNVITVKNIILNPFVGSFNKCCGNFHLLKVCLC